jgi:hypothetical protein
VARKRCGQPTHNCGQHTHVLPVSAEADSTGWQPCVCSSARARTHTLHRGLPYQCVVLVGYLVPLTSL